MNKHNNAAMFHFMSLPVATHAATVDPGLEHGLRESKSAATQLQAVYTIVMHLISKFELMQFHRTTLSTHWSGSNIPFNDYDNGHKAFCPLSQLVGRRDAGTWRSHPSRQGQSRSP